MCLRLMVAINTLLNFYYVLVIVHRKVPERVFMSLITNNIQNYLLPFNVVAAIVAVAI